jgi:DNA adenine methylase
MIGGGALFFALAPERALVADSNPELINFYRTLVENLDGMIAQYESWPFDEKTFYELRALKFDDLDNTAAAARLLYLNRACFNGLYRVNRYGQFNVPWGRYKRPYVIEVHRFKAARDALRRARIELGDFSEVLQAEAAAGDLIFLDPPYVPVSEYADFKRYTRKQFEAADHIRMAELVRHLSELGCEIIITNSNHPIVHDLYRGYEIEVVPTKRNVNSKGDGRVGEDVIINVKRA